MSRRHRPPASRTRLSLVGALVVLSACALPPQAGGPDPALDLPPAGTAAGALPPADWWRSFGDPGLAGLVEEALQNNRDLARAAARIDQSRAALQLARADRLPRVEAGASAGRQRISENGVFTPAGVSPVGSSYRASLDVAYEVDLWSRLARTHDAAREDLLATAHARDTLRIALAAQVVQSYVALQALDAQHALFERTVQSQPEGISLQRLRCDAGDIDDLDIRQLEAEPIWDGGRIAAQDELARARRPEVELDYRDTVALAFKEVRDALGARSESEASLRHAIEREQALSRAAQLTALRFDAGEGSRLDVIEAERAALAARSLVVDARRAVAAAQADLFRALGGGWEGVERASARGTDVASARLGSSRK